MKTSWMNFIELLEENDDELNGLYAHYNIVKKNVNTNYRNLPEYKDYENCGEIKAGNHIKPSFHFI